MHKKIVFKWYILLPLFIILITNNIDRSLFVVQSKYNQVTPKTEDIIKYFKDNKENLKYSKSEILLKLKKNDQDQIDILEKKYNIKVTRNKKNITTISYDSDKYSIEEILLLLSKDDNVIFAEPNYVLDNLATPSTEPYYINQWAYTNTNYGINITSTWSKTYGSSDVVVGVVDTGINYNHPDLSNNIWHNVDEIANNGIDDDLNGYIDDIVGWDFYEGINDPMDINGHGTHVAGIIAADVNGIGVVGVASDVKIMPLKVADAVGDIYINAVIEAIGYAEDNGVKVFNFSFGGTTDVYYFGYTIRDSNSLFIAAAGNDAKNNDITPFYPASYTYDNIISVAASTSTGRLASFSNYGSTSVDIAAPGSSIYSTYGSGYEYLDGTSMAAPYVTGQAALLYSYNNNLTYTEVKNYILNNKKAVTYLNGKVATNGIIDVTTSYNAINLFDGGDGSELNPYLISTNKQLNLIRNNLSASYKLTTDLDLTYDTQNPSGQFYNGGKGWLPIGTTTNSYSSTFMGSYFTGNFDGNGYSITGLYINRSDEYYLGLFANLKGTSSKYLSIKNIKLINTNIVGLGYTGSLSGYSSYITPTNIHNYGDLKLSTNSSIGYIGGLFGYTENSNLSYLSNHGSIDTKHSFTGGIVGKMINSTVSKSFNTSRIVATNDAGGIVGYASGDITDVYNLGSISDVSGYTRYRSGGIVGKLESGSINRTYFIGNLKQSNIDEEVSNNFKQIVGEVVIGTVLSSYYYNPYNLNNNLYGIELSIGDLYSSSSYIGFDFDNTWQINVDSKLPSLKNMTLNPLTDFSLSSNSVNLDLGSNQTYDILVNNTPINNYRDAYIYSSLDNNIAKVDSFGRITPIGIGNTTILVYSLELQTTKQISVYVEVLPKSISILENDNFTLKIDGTDLEKTKQLTYQVLPSEALGDIVWSSSNTDVATVDSNGLVRAVNAGVASIRITLIYNTITIYDEIKLTVTKTYIKGDLNSDNQITITDLVKLRRYLAGLEELDYTSKNAADINGDSQVTITDLVKLRRYLAGLEGL